MSDFGRAVQWKIEEKTEEIAGALSSCWPWRRLNGDVGERERERWRRVGGRLPIAGFEIVGT